MSDARRPHPLPALEDLPKLDRTALLETWRRVLADLPPKGLSSPYLRRFIAFELQTRRRGGLPKGFLPRLEAATAPKATQTVALKPGGRLLREWNGLTHVVDVLEDGFLWQGERYRSLSAIARAITGARWSGPRFFGLKASS